MNDLLLITLGALVSLTAIAMCASLGIATLTARRVLRPQRRAPIGILGLPSEGVVRLPATEFTTLDGTYGLLFDGEQHTAQIGPIVRLDTETGFVDRTVKNTSGIALKIGEASRWTGNPFSSPSEIADRWSEPQIAVDGGFAPAWLFEPASDLHATTWCLHIHGQLAGRDITFRSAAFTAKQGFTTLVPSYRGDGDAPTGRDPISMLGQTEWLDVEQAIRFAVDHGAERILLFGWSMGATIALILAERSDYRSLIAGLVLVSPVSDWRSCIMAGMDRTGLPKPLAWLAVRVLADRRWTKVIGSDGAIEFDSLNWTNHEASLAVPTLVVHSRGDKTAPFSESLRLQRTHPGKVTLVEAPVSPHALEWNKAGLEVEAAITDWLIKTIRLE